MKIRVIPHGMHLKSTKATDNAGHCCGEHSIHVHHREPWGSRGWKACLNPQVKGGCLPGSQGRSIKWGEQKPAATAEPSTGEEMSTERFNGWNSVIYASNLKRLANVDATPYQLWENKKNTSHKIAGNKMKKGGGNQWNEMKWHRVAMTGWENES